MRAIHIGAAVLGIAMVARPGMAGETVEADARVDVTTKVVMDDDVRAHVEELAAMSPTLQRQLAAIAAAPASVEVRVSAAPASVDSRAMTVISRYQFGYVKAEVVIPAGTDFVELLAHELEHVVEQIEGLDLQALARSGVASQHAGGIYETIRARDAGRAAAVEVEDAARALSAAH